MFSKSQVNANVVTAQGLSRHILDNFKKTSRSIKSISVKPDYLDYLASKAEQYSRLSEQAQKPEPAAKESMRLVQAIYDLLEPYAEEMTRANGRGPLAISIQAPTTTVETAEFDHMRRPIKTREFFRSRFSTSLLSLVIRGEDQSKERRGERVDFFLLPTSKVMGLSQNEALFAPLMSFIKEGFENSWTVENKALSEDRFERFTLLALEHLIDRTSEELTL